MSNTVNREELGFSFWQNVDKKRGALSLAEISRIKGLKYQRLKEQRSDNTLPRVDYAYAVADAIGTTCEFLLTGIEYKPRLSPRIQAIVDYLEEDERRIESFEQLFFGGNAGMSSVHKKKEA